MPEPSISLCMIVRNVETTLPRCLSSARGAVDEIIVVDTGSTDHTRELASTLGARVEEFPWCDDFSAAYNASLSYATSDWVFYMDGDEALLTPERLRELAATPDLDAWLVRVQHRLEKGNFFTDEYRLFKRGYTFEGFIHAGVELPPTARVKVHAEPLVEHLGFQLAVIAGKEKKERSARLAAREAEREPHRPVTRLRSGKGFLAAEQPDRALELLLAAIRLSPERNRIQAEAYLWAVVAARDLNDHAQAMELAESGVQLYPDYMDLHYLLGLELQAAGRLQEAGRHLGLALLLSTEPGPYPSSGGASVEQISAALAEVALRVPPKPAPVWPLVSAVDRAFPRVLNPWLPQGNPPWRQPYPRLAITPPPQE